MSNITTIDTSLDKWDTAVPFSMSTTARTTATITSVDLIATNLNLRSLPITMLSFDLGDIHRTAGNAVCQIVALWDMSSKLDIEARLSVGKEDSIAE
jgi:hypothetical protein